jgi:O-methyltransferase
MMEHIMNINKSRHFKLLRSCGNWLKYRHLYKQFKPYTMISQYCYVRNLALAHTVSNVAGAIVECGTWKGGMIAGMASVLGRNREYHLFDSLEGLPPAKEIDGLKAALWQSNTESEGYYDNCTASESDVREAMSLSGATDFTIHKGWFDRTVPEWSKTNPVIAVLRLDGDWYDSTMVCLRELAPLVAPNGLIIIDDYYAWEGCTKAVHEYLRQEQPFFLRQYSNGPCYLMRQERG